MDNNNNINNQSNYVIIYSNIPITRINYIITNTFETYRRDLSLFMQTMSQIVYEMNTLDQQFKHLKGSKNLIKLHNKFKNDILSQIPILWEHNEQVLRYLIDSNKCKLTYGLTMRPRK